MRTLCLLLALLVVQSTTLEVSKDQLNGNTSALLVEYIPEYQVKANDLDNLIRNQLSNVTIGTVKTAYATIDKISFQFVYKNGSNPTYLTPIKVQVTNDSYAISFNFTIKVKQTVTGSKTYTCQQATPLIYVNYTKETDLDTGSSVISGFSTTFSAATFNGNATCAQKPSDKDKTRIHEAVSNTQTSSVYLQVKKIVSRMPKDMQDNVADDHLSQVFLYNPYNYTYTKAFKMDVNVSTIQTGKFGQKGVVNKMRGTVAGASHFVGSLPSYQAGFNLFFTQEFVLNVLDYALTNNEAWKGIVANKTNMRTRTFRFRLADYEYIMPKILKKYPTEYFTDTQITCSVLSYQNFKLNHDTNLINVDFTWSCIGSLLVSGSSTYKFLNFEPTLSYDVTVEVRNNNDYLTVYEKVTKIVDINFNIVDDNDVTDVYMFKLIMEQGLFEFQGYPIGTFFKVKPGSSKVKINNQGIWVG